MGDGVMNKRVVFILAFGHLVNDFLINILTAILPLLVVHFRLSYAEVGILTMASNVSSSLVQPIFGYISDKQGKPWILGFSALALSIGLLTVEFAPSFVWLLPAVVVNGIGSAAFHPDGSRAVYFAAGPKRGFTQSIFQVGGNVGLAISALALWFLGRVGFGGIAWFMIPGVLSAALLFTLIRWFSGKLSEHRAQQASLQSSHGKASKGGLSLLVVIVTIRAWIVSGFMTFVPLYLIHSYGVKEKDVWLYSFVFLLFGAIGTMAGGTMADRFGQRNVIRMSMFVSTPLILLLPYLSRTLILVDMAAIGLFLLSTFAVTVVYGQELLPGSIAMVSGLLIGFAGGVAGLGIMVMGYVADAYGLHVVLEWICFVAPIAAICTLMIPIDRHLQGLRANNQVQLNP